MENENHNTEETLSDDRFDSRVLTKVSPADDRPLWQPTRAWLLLVGIGAPVAWLLGWALFASASTVPSLAPLGLADKTRILLTNPSFFFSTPLVACAAVCLALFLERPQEFRRLFPLRMAIYSGFLIVTYYWLLWAMSMAFAYDVLLVLCVLSVGAFPFGGLLWLLLAVRHGVPGRWQEWLVLARLAGMSIMSVNLVLLIVLSLLAAVVETPSGNLDALKQAVFLAFLIPPILLVAGFLLSTPTLTIIAYGGVSAYLFYHAWKDAKGQFGLKRIFIVTAWLAGLLSLWRIMVIWTFGT